MNRHYLPRPWRAELAYQFLQALPLALMAAGITAISAATAI